MKLILTQAIKQNFLQEQIFAIIAKNSFPQKILIKVCITSSFYKNILTFAEAGYPCFSTVFQPRTFLNNRQKEP